MTGLDESQWSLSCALVLSDIHHTRHAPKTHFLKRPGLSILIDLDRLDEAEKLSSLFSIDRLNLLSFHQKDYGCFHKSQQAEPQYSSLAEYIRALAQQYDVIAPIAHIELLTFPRILGVNFNPLSVYRCLDEKGQLTFVVYEVHNTFGEAHSYIGKADSRGRVSLHEARKIFHVSPFFDVTGDYQLLHRQQNDHYSLIIRYRIEGALALTATLRGTIKSLTSLSIITSLIKTKQWPMRPWFAIHVEAAKLFFKKLRYISKPVAPAQSHSLSSTKDPR